MKKITLSQLVVLGLTIISSQSFAAASVSGQFAIDNHLAEYSSDESVGLRPSTILKAILDFNVDIAPKLTAHVRLVPPILSMRGYLDLADRAYVNWTPLETIAFELGRTKHIAVNIDNNRYTPRMGRHIYANFNQSSFHNEKLPYPAIRPDPFGASVLGSVDSFNYKVSLVRDNEALDDTSVGEGLSWCYGGRASYTVVNSKKMSWALGLGFFNKPRKVPNEFDFYPIYYSGGPSSDSSTSITAISFKGEEGLTVDLNGTVGNFSLTAAALSSKLKVDNIKNFDISTHQFSEINDSSSPALSSLLRNPFNKTGKLDTGFVEASYLINGQGYSFKNGVVSGLQSSKSVLEVGSRLSQSKSRASGILLLSTFLYKAHDLARSYTPLEEDHLSEQGAYQDGYYFNVHNYVQSIFVNYHVDKNLSFKTEFLNETDRINQNIYLNSAHADAFNDLKLRQITVRLDYSF